MTETFYNDDGVAVLELDFEIEGCNTLCGDSYYDYTILSFDEVIRLADCIKKWREQGEAVMKEMCEEDNE